MAQEHNELVMANTSEIHATTLKNCMNECFVDESAIQSEFQRLYFTHEPPKYHTNTRHCHFERLQNIDQIQCS